MTGTVLVILRTFITIPSPLTFTVFQHTISSGANLSSSGSEASGCSGATTSLKSYHNPDSNQLNSQICTLFVGKDSSSLTMPDAVSESHK